MRRDKNRRTEVETCVEVTVSVDLCTCCLTPPTTRSSSGATFSWGSSEIVGFSQLVITYVEDS